MPSEQIFTPGPSRRAAGARLGLIRDLYRLRPFARGYLRATPLFLVLNLIALAADAGVVGLTILFLKTALGAEQVNDDGNGLLSEFAAGVFRLVPDQAFPLALSILALTLARVAAEMALGLLDSALFAGSAHQVRRTVHARYMNGPYAYVAGLDQAYLLNVLSAQSERASEAFQILKNIALDLVAIGGFAVLLFLASWQIALLGVAGAVVVWWGVRRVATAIERISALGVLQHRLLTRQILLGLQALRTLKAFGQTQAEHARFERRSRKVRDVDYRIDRLQTFLDPIGDIGRLAVVAGLVLLIRPLGVPLAALVTALALMYRLQPHVGALSAGVLKLMTIAPHLALVREALDGALETAAPAGETPYAGLADAVRFESVSFTYPGAAKPSLQSVSLSLPVGSTTALVGASGSGKTSLINLLLRLYEPSEGRILADAADLAAISPGDWHGRLAIAGQDVDLLEGSIGANIRLARPSASREEVLWAAEIAEARDFIDALPDGLATWVGERGYQLSGGQRQRIGIARAVLCRPSLLILDEATSAMDDPLEAKLRGNLRRALPDATVLLVTHRLHTLSDVGQVIVLAGGQVTQSHCEPALRAAPRPTAAARA
ncbi:MAG TPA: ABC transporter ATP-binding protein [Caulobacteraceae bacterium]